MGIKKCDKYLTVVFAAALSSTSHAMAAGAEWQKERLLDPTPSQLAVEAKGRVAIYDGVGLPGRSTGLSTSNSTASTA